MPIWNFALTVAINPQMFVNFFTETRTKKRLRWQSMTHQDQKMCLHVWLQCILTNRRNVFLVDHTYELTENKNIHLHAQLRIEDCIWERAVFLMESMQQHYCGCIQTNMPQKYQQQLFYFTDCPDEATWRNYIHKEDDSLASDMSIGVFGSSPAHLQLEE